MDGPPSYSKKYFVSLSMNSYSLEYSACPHFLIMRAALIKYKIENLIERLNFSFPTYFGEENKRKF